MKSVQKFWKRLRSEPRLADLISLGGFIAYLAQSIVYIFTSRTMLDEGLYLVKGWYFANGTYTPFQDYGVLTNQMPLSFLIPGFFLKLFGANLLTGRGYAVLLGAIGLWLLWLATRRLSTPSLAAGVVWAVALNVAVVRIYSLALSQVLVNVLLVGMLVLSLRRVLEAKHAFAAGLLCAVMVLVRINMLPLLGIWLLYLLWQHGAKLAAWGGLGFLAGFIPVHALYWPNILRLWAYWIPQGWIPALQPFYTPWDKYTGAPLPTNWDWLTNLEDRTWDPIISFWEGVRFNFVLFAGTLANLLLWPKRKSWPDVFAFRLAVFLNVAFVGLTLVHMWASLGTQSCTSFCFSGYMAFFSSLGLLAVAVTAPHWRHELSWGRAAFVALAVLLLLSGVGFATAEDTGAWLANLNIPIGANGIPFWGLFENKFGISYHDSRRIIPTLTGLGVAAAVIAGVLIFTLRKGTARKAPSAFLAGLLLLGLLLSPTALLSYGDANLQCGGNVIAAYASLGDELTPLVSSSDKIYYQGPNSPAILMYLPPATIYPPQLNNVFSFSNRGGDASADELLRFGYWNEELKQQWIGEADLVLIEARRYPEWQALVEDGTFNIVAHTGVIEECRGKDSEILLLRRK